MNNTSALIQTLVSVIRDAVTSLPCDVEQAMADGMRESTSPEQQRHLDIALRNLAAAKEHGTLYCKVDTGVPMFFVKPSSAMPQELQGILAEAVRQATGEGILKPSVADPFTGDITPDNLGAGVPCVIYGRPEGDVTEVTYFPNACAADRLAAIAHFKPPVRDEDVIAVIRKTITDGRGRPCQPIIVGVGIGGTADVSMMLSKAALLRPVGSQSSNLHARGLEAQALNSINSDGAGVHALALAVHIEVAAAHRVTCPISINLLCRAARRATVRISDTGEVQVV